MDRWIMDQWIGGSLILWHQRENKCKNSRGYWSGVKNRAFVENQSAEGT